MLSDVSFIDWQIHLQSFCLFFCISMIFLVFLLQSFKFFFQNSGYYNYFGDFIIYVLNLFNNFPG